MWEILIKHQTGEVDVFATIRNLSKQVMVIVAGAFSSWETWNNSNVATYAIACTENGGGAFYASIPSGVAEQILIVEGFQGAQDGTADVLPASRVDWTGSAERFPNIVVPDVSGTANSLHSTTNGNISALNDFDPATETVDMGKISGDSIAANNLESMFDGVGYNDPEAPAKQSQLSSLANVGAAINIAVSEDNTGGAIKGITFVGSQTLTYSATQAADDVYHKIDDTTNVIDIVYGFDIGGDGIPTQLSMLGFLNGNNDALKVFGYDFVTTSWNQIGTLTGKAQEVNDSLTFALFLNMVGTSGSDLGKVYIRFQNTGQSNPDLNIDHLFVSYSIVRRTVGYANGAIWIDTNNGTAGTENYVNGTADNPVLTLADALTIATALSLSHFRIVSSSTITLTTASESQLYAGDNWTIILNGQNISGTAIIGADVSGIGTGASRPRFTNCHFGDTTLPPSQLDFCGMSGTFTLGVAGTFCLDNCHSDVAGLQTPFLDFGSALNASSINLRDYSGGIHLKNMGAGTGAYTLSMEGDGQLIINANCSADSTIAIRGNFTIVNNASGITISDDARYDVTQIDDTITNNTLLLNHFGLLNAHHTDFGEVQNLVDETWERVIANLDVVVSTRATQAKQDIIDTNVDSILEDTGTTIPATLATTAKTGADSDTLETLSDQIDAIASAVNIEHSTNPSVIKTTSIETVDGTVDRTSDPEVESTIVDRESTASSTEGSVTEDVIIPDVLVDRGSNPSVQGD